MHSAGIDAGAFLDQNCIEDSTLLFEEERRKQLLIMLSGCYFFVRFLFGCNFRNIINSPQAKLKRWNTNGNFNLQHKNQKHLNTPYTHASII